MSSSWTTSTRTELMHTTLVKDVRDQERDMEVPLSADTVVIGVGNIILSDDGVGVHAARLLQIDPRLPSGINVLDGGTMGPELVSFASDASHVLLLDAMNSGSVPGTLARMTGRDLLATEKGWSVHQMAVADLISALLLVASCTQEILVLGVQPANTDWGTILSREVEAAVAPLVDAAVAQLQLWHESPTVHPSPTRIADANLIPAAHSLRPLREGGF